VKQDNKLQGYCSITQDIAQDTDEFGLTTFSNCQEGWTIKYKYGGKHPVSLIQSSPGSQSIASSSSLPFNLHHG
jgi:hypothetical protein